MQPKLEAADYLDGYRIHLTFSDGTAADVDFANELWGEVFEPLRVISEFQKFRLDRELNTLLWSNGADFAPEYLYEEALKSSALK